VYALSVVLSGFVGDWVFSIAEEKHFWQFIDLAMLSEYGVENAVDFELVGGEAAEWAKPSWICWLCDHVDVVAKVEALKMLAENAPCWHFDAFCAESAKQGNLDHLQWHFLDVVLPLQKNIQQVQWLLESCKACAFDFFAKLITS
jgi:hypothetical protein